MAIEKIELRIYGDADMFTQYETTKKICDELEEAIKKTMPYGSVGFSFVLLGKNEKRL